jgi:Protein of unknown function (DUF1566)
MAEGSAKKQDIKGSYGEGFVIMGGDRIEVSPDGKKVTAYTNDGVETKAASGEAPAQGISISADFNTVVLNGATIERAADGHLVISAPGGTVITKPAPANDSTATSATPQIGDRMPAGHANAGWIYAGVSKTTNQPLYVAPKDSGVFQWKAAMEFAAKEGARVPSKEELDQIHDAMDKGALKGTFNVTGSNSAGWYWSSSQYYGNDAWAQRFSDGHQDHNGKSCDSSLRCVR